MSVSAGVSDSAVTVREKLRGKIGQTRVKRYWPGKAPEWADEVSDDAEIKAPRSVASLRADVEKAFPLIGDLELSAKDDPRLLRLEANRRDREAVVAQHRKFRQAEILRTREEEERAAETAELEEEEDDDAIEERRRRIKERLLQRQREDEMGMEEEEEEYEEEEDESEYETDFEEEFGGIAMIKPVFVPKIGRETIAEREKLKAEDDAVQESVKKKLEDRKVETRHFVVEVIKQEKEIEKNREAQNDGGEIDTDDETNEAEEYESWKAREIARIKRDRENREATVKEKEEIEKLRNMTDDERREWERKNPKQLATAKKKWKFMQKYYHKGAFFQSGEDGAVTLPSSDDIFRRDFSAPTGEDKLDKTILPKVMQVKHFGRSGRTKWTHLVAEDTTQWDNPWTYNDPMRAKYNNKMAGMNRPISKPQGSKKLKDWE